MKVKMNNKGFSLIELMVVVAIIGILAAVGIPQYSKFQSKARTGEAKAALSALYSAEKAFQLEFNGYTVDLRNVGFAVEGTNLRYVTGFTSGTACTNYPAVAAPAETTTRTQTVSVGVYTTGSTWLPVIAGVATGIPTGPNAAVTGTTCVSTAGAQVYTAMSKGDPRANALALSATSDTWTITQDKLILNSVVGF